MRIRGPMIERKAFLATSGWTRGLLREFLVKALTGEGVCGCRLPKLHIQCHHRGSKCITIPVEIV